MQTNILRSLALTAVGNAAIAGRDVSRFWPHAALLKFYKQIEFVVPRDKKIMQAAPDPVAWFEKLRLLGCTGLRLHGAPMQQNPKVGPQPERMLVALVGGGPRWLVEVVFNMRSEIWEGHDRIGDRDDPQRKIWLGAYLLLGEIDAQNDAERDVVEATADVRTALTEIEGFARELPGAPFASDFAAARAELDGDGALSLELDFVAMTMLERPAIRLLAAATRGWVFGAMGSWNDIVPEDALKARYEETSEALFLALQRAVIVVANSTYRG